VKLWTKKALDAFLGACPFKVREVKRGKMDSSDPYFGSTLAFALDGTLVLTYGNGTVLKGQWNSAETDLGMQLILEFPDPTDFNLDWQVYRSGDRTLVLYRGQGDKIALKKWCDGISVD